MTFLARHVCLCLPAKKSACALKRNQSFTEQAVYSGIAPFASRSLSLLPSILVFEFQGERKSKAKGWRKKDSNVHNNQTAFAYCLDHINNTQLACRAIAKNLKNLALAISQLYLKPVWYLLCTRYVLQLAYLMQCCVCALLCVFLPQSWEPEQHKNFIISKASI